MNAGDFEGTVERAAKEIYLEWIAPAAEGHRIMADIERRLRREFGPLVEALRAAESVPFEPDKWLPQVRAALGVGPETLRERKARLLSFGEMAAAGGEG